MSADNRLGRRQPHVEEDERFLRRFVIPEEGRASFSPDPSLRPCNRLRTIRGFAATAMPDPDWWLALWPEPERVLAALGVRANMAIEVVLEFHVEAIGR